MDDYIVLSPKQISLVRSIHASWKERGFGPLLRELAEERGITAVTVWEALKRLEAKGALRGEPRVPRSTRLPKAMRTQLAGLKGGA